MRGTCTLDVRLHVLSFSLSEKKICNLLSNMQLWSFFWSCGVYSGATDICTIMHDERLDMGPLSVQSYPHAWRALCNSRGCKSWLICIVIGNKALIILFKITSRNRLKAYFMQRNEKMKRNTLSFVKYVVWPMLHCFQSVQQQAAWTKCGLRRVFRLQDRKHARSWLIFRLRWWICVYAVTRRSCRARYRQSFSADIRTVWTFGPHMRLGGSASISI